MIVDYQLTLNVDFYWVEVRKKCYCSLDYMRDDEMKNTGNPFKCVTRYDDEMFFCYLSEVDTIKDSISQFL